jgi:hypothetical protein
MDNETTPELSGKYVVFIDQDYYPTTLTVEYDNGETEEELFDTAEDATSAAMKFISDNIVKDSTGYITKVYVAKIINAFEFKTEGGSARGVVDAPI